MLQGYCQRKTIPEWILSVCGQVKTNILTKMLAGELEYHFIQIIFEIVTEIRHWSAPKQGDLDVFLFM